VKDIVMRKLKILLIDDSPFVLKIYRGLLGEIEAETESANDGWEGLRKAKSCAYDLIITDIEMPGMDGLEVCRLLRSEPATANTPLIIISNFNSDSHVTAGFEVGASAHLCKSEVQSLLLKTIEEVVWKNRHILQRKILIVDDSPSLLNLVQDGLNRSGFVTTSAANGREAMTYLFSEKPDLILSDINMPEMNGFDLCKKVKTDPELASIPFVVMSTNDDRAYMKLMIQYGAASYLVRGS
jgi:putative two-component system response regulator